MAIFDKKHFDDVSYQKYKSKLTNTKLNNFIKSGVLKRNDGLAARMTEAVGRHMIAEPIKGLLDGDVINYDGKTDITATSRTTYLQNKVVLGRAKAWQEKDFSTDISGAEFMPYGEMAAEVNEYYEGVDQEDILAILKGIFSMSDEAGAAFVAKHTTELADAIKATSLNRAITKASGDHRNQYSMAIMHSNVAADLEDLNVLTFLTQTDANGIQRDLGLATWNGRLVVIDDDAPVSEDGKYTTYVLGKESIEYADCGVKVPSEMVRDAFTDGGIDVLVTRQRHLYAPKYISFTNKAVASLSPKAVELANGANWEIVNDGDAESKTYVNDKLIPFVRIISKVSE
jgi:hypothetical protein